MQSILSTEIEGRTHKEKMRMERKIRGLTVSDEMSVESSIREVMFGCFGDTIPSAPTLQSDEHPMPILLVAGAPPTYFE